MIRLGAFFLFALLIASPALAHGGWPLQTTWNGSPTIVIPLYLIACLYLFGTHRLWRHAGFERGVQLWRIACFWAGWTVLALSLLSPLHWWSERLLWAHMIEHELIMAVAAPLLVLSRPLGILAWGSPRRFRALLGTLFAAQALLGLSNATIATILHAATIWIWHVPRVFDAALSSSWLHTLQHVTFLATALMFWRAVLTQPRDSLGSSALHLLATMLALTFLGAAIALAPSPLYANARETAGVFGLDQLADQQLAGVIMWVPGCAIYAGAALAILGIWIGGRAPHDKNERALFEGGFLKSSGAIALRSAPPPDTGLSETQTRWR